MISFLARLRRLPPRRHGKGGHQGGQAEEYAIAFHEGPSRTVPQNPQYIAPAVGRPCPSYPCEIKLPIMICEFDAECRRLKS